MSHDLRAVIERRLLRTCMGLPGALRSRLMGAPPRNDRGDQLDAGAHVMCWLEDRVPGAGLGASSPAESRAALEHSMRIIQGRDLAQVGVEQRSVAGVSCRLYRGPAPAQATLVYAHGGGWVAGSVQSHDRACQRMALEAGRAVLSVDYRLAPEHPFPAGLHDLLDVLRVVLADPAAWGSTRVEVGGDSAGGNLAAAACLALRQEGHLLPDLQWLIYPALDLACTTPSHRTMADGYLLTEAKIHWYKAKYGAPLQDPLASPLVAPDLAGLPPALITTAGFDPLRDEGEHYADRLQQAGVPVHFLPEPGLVHGWLNMDGVLPAADRAVARQLAALRAAVD